MMYTTHIVVVKKLNFRQLKHYYGNFPIGRLENFPKIGTLSSCIVSEIRSEKFAFFGGNLPIPMSICMELTTEEYEVFKRLDKKKRNNTVIHIVGQQNAYAR